MNREQIAQIIAEFKQISAESKSLYKQRVLEIHGPGVSVLLSDITPAEQRLIDRSNAIYPQYKKALQIKALLDGKRMASRFSGKSTLTGSSFEEGVEIYYINMPYGTHPDLTGKFVAPVSEVEAELRS